MKNYSVKFEFEYWTHAETEEQALRISEEKLMEDLRNNEASLFADVKVEEIGEP